MEEVTQPKIKKGRWHFWFLIVFSLLLIAVFVFYLPLRFQSSTQEHEEEPSIMEEDDHLNVIDVLFPVVLADEGHSEEESHETVESDQLKPLVSPVWWLLLIVSLVIMTLLSLGIYKFIHVKK